MSILIKDSIGGSISGNAATATALTTKSKGSATQPVYWDSNGKPVACTYSLEKSVPADALFSDTALGKTFKTGVTAASHASWDNTTNQDKIIPTMNFLAYWNGAYNSSNSSNLAYCKHGEFGTAATAAKTDFVAATDIGAYFPRRRMTNPDPGHASIGAIPLILALKAAGKPVYSDPEFAAKNSAGAYTNNSCTVYNNSNNGAVTITNIADNQNSANSSGRILQISTTSATVEPGRGGFVQNMSSAAGKIFCQIFRAKIPTGFSVVNAENSMGATYKTYWMTDTAGTGKWEWYCRITICGTSGTYSGGGHVYLKGSGAVTWYLSYCNTFELSNGAYDGLRTQFADKLSTARTISLTGAVTGSTTFDGSANASISTKVNHSHSFNDITDAPNVYLNSGTVTRRVLIQNTKNSNGYISRATIGLTNPASKFSPVFIGVGTNDAGTTFTDYYFSADGSITDSKGYTYLSSNNYTTYCNNTYLKLAGGTLTGKVSTAGTCGTWISGKTAAAIQYNGLTKIDHSSFWSFFNMKSSNQDVITFGGLGNDIGFYGYYAATTANQTDWKFTVNTTSGIWTFSKTPKVTISGTNYDVTTAKDIGDINALLDKINGTVV